MITIETKEIVIGEELKRKVEMICRFTNTKPIIKNGSIRSLKGTNIRYIEPHRIVINDITFLVFNYSNGLYIKNLNKKLDLKDLEEYLKSV